MVPLLWFLLFLLSGFDLNFLQKRALLFPCKFYDYFLAELRSRYYSSKAKMEEDVILQITVWRRSWWICNLKHLTNKLTTKLRNNVA